MAISCALEATAVLLAVRNILVVQLVKVENIRKFILLVEKELVLPIKLNTYAVMSLVAGFVVYVVDIIGSKLSVILIMVFITPVVMLLFVSISKGIQSLQEVQPFHEIV